MDYFSKVAWLEVGEENLNQIREDSPTCYQCNFPLILCIAEFIQLLQNQLFYKEGKLEEMST